MKNNGTVEDSAYASGIHCSINAALPAFKNFQRIPPSHRIHAPVLHERYCKKVLFSARIRSESPSPQTNAGFQKKTKGERYWRYLELRRPLSRPQFRLSPIPLLFGPGTAPFLRLRAPFTFFRNPAYAGKTLPGLRKPRKQRSAFSNAFLRGCAGG